MAIKISTSVIAAVAQWASAQDHEKPYFELVVFSHGEIIAADGHRAVVLQHDTDGLTFGLHRSHLLAAVAAQDAIERDGQDPPIAHDVQCDDDDAVLTSSPRGIRGLEFSRNGPNMVITIAEGVAMRVPTGDISRFPDVGELLNGKPETPSPGGHVFNPRYLAAIGDVHRAMGGGEDGVKCVAWEAGRLGCVRFENRLGATFVVMPMRA